MFIKLFDNFIIKIIGGPGKKLLTSMFLEYYDAKVLYSRTFESQSHQSCSDSEPIPKPSLCIFLGKDQEEIRKLNSVPFLIGILSKKDYTFISSFCQEHNLRLYISPTKKIFSYYKHLNLPLFDYIHLSLAVSVSALKNKLLLEDSNISESIPDIKIVNVEKELLSIDHHKPFHIRSSQIKKDEINIDIIWEPGTKLIGNKLMMEWIRKKKIGTLDATHPNFYTIIDIDKIYETSDMKEYLLPFTTLGIYQKGILIVNSEEPSDPSDLKPEDGVFDYHIYTNMMELWNNKHYIPKRLTLLENTSDSLGYRFEESGESNVFNPEYELSINKPPIFILDNFESIHNFVSKLNKNTSILYIGKEENYKKLSNL